MAEKNDNSKMLEGVDEGKELKKKLEECERQSKEYLSGWQRAKADFVNYKKEETARLQEVAKYATEDLMQEFVTVLDSFDLGLAALEKQGPVEKGVYMIRAQIEDALRRRGLVKIPLKAGDAFAPEVAESVGDAVSEHPEGTIAEVIEPGYRLHEKVVRPARVKLSKGTT